ncbi:MAG TPA: hypothetical protein VG269_08025 [Tepidisphaeraceae bacterium]|jgi:hypothetical protein|nr:hypothetical protein [Tepidisphaeraceae bacterium]
MAMLSSLLLVGTGALWWRSFDVSETWSRPTADARGRYVGDVSLQVYAGGIRFARTRLAVPVPAFEPIPGQIIRRTVRGAPKPYGPYAGFGWGSVSGSIWMSRSGWSRDADGVFGYYMKDSERFLIVPVYALFLTWAMLPMIWSVSRWCARRGH